MAHPEEPKPPLPPLALLLATVLPANVSEASL
jgi:hypothetical protein